MPKDVDARGQRFENVGPVRLTYIKKEQRSAGRDWAGKDVIRIQAYVGAATRGRLHPGAEIPVDGPGGVLEVITALCKLGRG